MGCGGSVSNVPLPGDGGGESFVVKDAGYGEGYTVYTGDGKEKWMHVTVKDTYFESRHKSGHTIEVKSLTKPKTTLAKVVITNKEEVVSKWEKGDSKNLLYQEDMSWKEGKTAALIPGGQKTLELLAKGADAIQGLSIDGDGEEALALKEIKATLADMSEGLQDAADAENAGEQRHIIGKRFGRWKWKYAREAKFEDGRGKLFATVNMFVSGYSHIEKNGAGNSISARPIMCRVVFDIKVDGQEWKTVPLTAPQHERHKLGPDSWNIMAKASVDGTPQKLGPNLDRNYSCDLFDSCVSRQSHSQTARQSRSQTAEDSPKPWPSVITVKSKAGFPGVQSLAIAFALAYPMHPPEMMMWEGRHKVVEEADTETGRGVRYGGGY